MVEATDGKTRGSAARARPRCAGLRVGRRGDVPGRLVQQVVDEVGARRHRHAVDRDVLALRIDASPSTATSPSTVTRPSAMSTSHARREPEAGAREQLLHVARASAQPASTSGVGSGPNPRRVVESGVLVEAQAALERLDHRDRARNRRAAAGRRGSRGRAARGSGRGAVEDGVAGARVAADFLHVAALDERRSVASTLTPRIAEICRGRSAACRRRSRASRARGPRGARAGLRARSARRTARDRGGSGSGIRRRLGEEEAATFPSYSAGARRRAARRRGPALDELRERRGGRPARSPRARPPRSRGGLG